MRALARRVALAAVAVAALACASVASADTAHERALAQKYAPVVRLVDQPEPCGPGEPYQPIDVDVLFDEPSVALMGPWGRDLVTPGPSATETAALWRAHLDFPGDALRPGCDFEEWERAITKGRSPTVYAHLATEAGRPGKLALQYWFFYVYNDWNNLHEGDWEMIQLVFDADDAREALTEEPVLVGYSQHEGAEGAAWGDDKLEIVDGTHPVVHPAAGSHANFFGSALYLGSSRTQGVGCDDTRAPLRDVRPAVRTIPSDPAEATAAYPWIDFNGRWGELQPSFFNGPTGPNMKTQWTEPISWSDDLRDRSFAVPASGAFGTTGTDFFCGAFEKGSRALHRLLNAPLLVGAILLVLGALVWFGLSRATWRPSAPLRVARRRTWGQILAASTRMYLGRAPLFIGIGLVFIPISIAEAGIQSAIFRASSVFGIGTGGEGGGFFALVLFVLATALTYFGFGLVHAATVRALVEVDRGAEVGPIRAYRMVLPRWRPLLGSLAVAGVAVTLLASTLVLVPVAVWLAVRWALIAPVSQIEDLDAPGTRRRSWRLVRGRWLKVGSLTILGGAVALAIGPFLGALLIVLTRGQAPFALINLVAGIVYVVATPFVALATSYAYFDARAREGDAVTPDPATLPAEFEVPA